MRSDVTKVLAVRRRGAPLLIVLIGILLLAGSQAQALLSFEKKFGEQGSGPEQLLRPWDVEAYTAPGSETTTVYVPDQHNHRVQVFDGRGNFKMTIGQGVGQGDGQLYFPEALALSPDGISVYVADTGNNRIVEFGAISGDFIRTWGTEGFDPGQFRLPRGIAVDSSGNIYVADTRNTRIQKFTSSGTFIKQWGTSGSADGQFLFPAGVAVGLHKNSQEIVFVADETAGVISEFTSDGVFLRKYGEYGEEPGQLSFPDELDYDEVFRELHVVEAGTQRVTVFRAGELRRTSARLRGTYTGTPEPNTFFQHPHGVFVDGESRQIFVASSEESLIYKLAYADQHSVRIIVDPINKPATLKNQHGLRYKVRDTEMMDTCMIKGEATVRIPDDTSFGIDTKVFDVSGPLTPAKPKTMITYEIPLEGEAYRLAKEALNEHRTIRVTAHFRFSYQSVCSLSFRDVETVKYSISG